MTSDSESVPNSVAPEGGSGDIGGDSGPLAGLRIVEVSGYVAAPLCGMTLAQLGAEVIRVEPIGGAPDRARLPHSETGTSLYWTGLNKGKRSIEVDLSTAAGRALVVDLVAECGVLLTNSERHLRFDELRARRPDVIHAVLTGRRDGGPAVDYTVNAATGFPTVTGPEDGRAPVNHLLPAWDVAAGLYLTVGLLAAERRRRLTAQAQQVRIALEDVALATAGNLGYLAEAQLSSTPRDKSGNYVYGTFGRDFTTADGRRVMVVALTTAQWRELVRVTGIHEALTALAGSLGADFDAEEDRYRHRRVLAALLDEWFEARTHDEVTTVLGNTRVLWSTYRSFRDLAADEARILRESPVMAPLDQPGVGPHLAPGSPLVINGRQAPPQAAPAVGEHTEETLCAQLRMSESDLRQLTDKAVVGNQRRSEPTPR
ncbi:CoA transferase [Nocardia jiangxiensis]|uniref:CoA transferase n=1 Tax=Nocardia jiangxiensis TaxID=282685 RepID=A0ABW6S8B1_9NOCA